MILSGMHIFEEGDEIYKYNQFIENLFGMLQPKAYERYRKTKDQQRSEEGVDQVIYTGEDDWESTKKTLEEFGFSNLDFYGDKLSNG